MIATHNPSTLPHDSMLHSRLEGQQTGDSSASDGGSATTHTTDTTMPSSVGSVGSPGGSGCGGAGAGDDAAEGVGQLPPTTSVPAAARKYHRHMARSAAKRQSVASLPSIRDLQLQFSGGMVQHRAGAGAGIRPSPLGSGAQGREDDEASVRRDSKPWKDVQLARVSPTEARREAQALARTLSAQWALDSTPEDLRSLFVDTARAVRRVRTLSLSLVPPERRVSGPQRPVAAFSTPSRPSGVGQGVPRVVSGSSTPPARDPGAPMRRAALDLLGNLRALEERLRDKAGGDVPAVVVVAEQSDGELVDSPVDDSPSLPSMDRRDSTHSLSPSPRREMRGGSPSSIISYDDDDVWLDDDGFDVNAAAREAEAAEAHTLWEDRLVAEGRTYAAPSGESWAADSAPTLAAARRWVEAVSRVFGDAADPAAHAWVANTGMERVHAFLVAHLSREHAALLPGPGAKELLERLSDGYLLVQAYNASLLASPRPWGFIPDEDVYDTLAAGPDAGREWTFRRVNNLTCLAAALRTRFNLPIAMAAGGAVAPTLSRRRSVVPSVEFDPLAVAKRSGAWDEALRAVLLAWVAEAADEVRGGNREADVPEEAAEPEEIAEAERVQGHSEQDNLKATEQPKATGNMTPQDEQAPRAQE